MVQAFQTVKVWMERGEMDACSSSSSNSYNSSNNVTAKVKDALCIVFKGFGECSLGRDSSNSKQQRRRSVYLDLYLYTQYRTVYKYQYTV